MAGLYIHIPFCHSKCAYCDFYSRPSLTDAEGYIDALITEWAVRKHELRDPVRTLYIGGGTPSILPVRLMRRLLDGIGADYLELDEFTVEANPEDVTEEWIDALTDLNVNRISMGVQSLIDNELVAVGRRHTSEQALMAMDIIHQGGIHNLSCDLIYGLPAQTMESWKVSLNGLLDRGLTHLSAYMLTYERGTRLYARRMAGKIQEATDELLSDMYDMLIEVAAGHGMEHYEISNFGMPGFRSLHNSGYWNNTPYLGLGPSAHSFDGAVRRYNPSDMKLYMSKPHEAFVKEIATADTIHNDCVITSLRTMWGIDISGFTEAELALVRKYVDHGIMQHVSDNRYRISEKGWLLADAIMTDFIRVDDQS